MLKLGLTGGIASGKSAVAVLLRQLDFPVLDADSLAHKLMEPGQLAYREVAVQFGSSILDAEGRIDRTKLGPLVFADQSKLELLNSILHPRVAELITDQFLEWERSGIHDAAFAEAALIVEAGLHRRLDGLVVAWCRPEQQLERLLARGLSEAESRRRIAAQLPVEEKLRYATERIDCSGSLEQTRRQVESLAARLRRPGSDGLRAGTRICSG